MELINDSRMKWVDAMRGFSMVIVVLGHVLISMGVGGYSAFLSTILLTFRMPLFFFVSGFFSYRAITWWNSKRVQDIIKRKFQAQIFSTLVFFVLFQYINGQEISILEGFGGYWFTIVLFQMYLIYLALSLLSKRLSINIVNKTLIVVSIIFIGVLVLYDRSSFIWKVLSWENLTKYTQFFTLGIICSKYRTKLFKLLENNKFITTIITFWIICMILWYNPVFKVKFPYLYSFIHDILVRYAALLVVLKCFYTKRDYWTLNNKISKWMGFIGRRTLDIYMLHYFFIPNLIFLKGFLQGTNSIIIQLLISGGITTVIIAVCLLISNILRQSSTIESWLFGVKVCSST